MEREREWGRKAREEAETGSRPAVGNGGGPRQSSIKLELGNFIVPASCTQCQ